MSVRQVGELYMALPRSGDGTPDVQPALPPMPDREELFRYGLFLLGVTDPATVERLWREEKAKGAPAPEERQTDDAGIESADRGD